jgi:hypothetical protein
VSQTSVALNGTICSASASSISGPSEGTGGTKAQQCKFEKDDGYYKIVNRKSGKVLDVKGNRTEEGVPIIDWDDEGNDNQRWSWEGNDKVGRLKSKSSTLV